MWKKAILLVFLMGWLSFAGAKYQVCSITINSSDEIEMFKKHLDPHDFEFVELVPLSQKSHQPNDIHWFKKACEKNYKCDLMVISGHFGGLFFGENHNYILPVNTMERQACAGSCTGLLSHVKEVFLFGCNTLSGKEQDQRTPEEYLQVLLDHNYARDMAEIVVAGRYLPFGLSFKTQMRLIFSGESHIYGFSSLSPLGEYLRSPLANYFNAIKAEYGSYKAYLDQKTAFSKNPVFHSAIGSSSTETTGLKIAEDLFPDFQKMCHLYKKSTTKTGGLNVIQDLMDQDKAQKTYYAIKSFVLENQPFEGESQKMFKAIQNNETFQAQFADLYGHISSQLPYVRIQFLNFLKSFNWVSHSSYKKELREHTLQIAIKSNSSAFDFVTALVHDEKINTGDLNLTVSDFPPTFYKNVWSPLILETLKVQDYLVHRRLMNLCLSRVRQDVQSPKEKPVICYQVFKSLGNLNVSDSLTVQKMANFLNYSHNGLIYFAIYGLAKAGVKTREVHLGISQHFENPDSHIQNLSVWAVGYLRSQNDRVNEQLVGLVDRIGARIQEKTKTSGASNTTPDLEPEEKLLENSFIALSRMDPPRALLREVIKKRELDQYPKDEIQDWAKSF